MLLNMAQICKKLHYSTPTTRLMLDRFNIKIIRKGKFVFYEISTEQIKKIKEFMKLRLKKKGL